MDELSRRSRSAGSQGRTAARSGAAGRKAPAGSSRARGSSSGQRSTRSGSSYNSRGRSAGAAAGEVMTEGHRFHTAETQNAGKTLRQITFGLPLREWY